MTNPYTPGGVVKTATHVDTMQEEVAEWIVEKGWNDDRTFGDEMILITSELVEALEAFRDRGFEEWVTHQPTINGVKLPKMTPEQLEALGIPEEAWGMGRREGVAPELAGTFVRLLDTCERHGIRLGQEFRQEMEYNWKRAFRHGGRAL